MKKLLLKFWGFLNSIFLQTLLSYFAYISWETAERLGYKTQHNLGAFLKNLESEDYMATDIDLEVGFDGGAIAMGLITAACILGVVWIQINKTKP
jgi:hypothetical protein